MITVPPREIAAFLGNHLDHVLQQTELDFAQNIANNRQFKAGCALMDVLNSVESVHEWISAFLREQAKNSGREKVESSELAPSTPSELIAIALEVDSKQVDLQILEDLLPDVPIENQILPGQGWESVGQRKHSEKKEAWDPPSLPDGLGDSGPIDSNLGIDNPSDASHLDFKNGIFDEKSKGMAVNSLAQETIVEEEELEEWEIEAEKHFKGSEDVAPAPAVSNTKAKKQVDVTFNRQQLNTIMEQASIQALSFDQEQFMLSQFNEDTAKVHIPLPLPESLPGIVDNNPTIAFNLLQYLIQLSSELNGNDVGTSQKSNGVNSSGRNGKTGVKDSSFSSPEPSIVDSYLYTMTHAKRLTLHSLEVVNRLSAATALSPQFLHAYIENAIRCCELVEDKVGQARVVRMLCVFLQSLLRNEAITIPGYFHALQSFCVQFARVKEVATLFQSLVEYQRKMDTPPIIQTQGSSIRSQPSQHQPQQASRQQTQSTSVPSTPTADIPQRSSWLANSGSISNIKSTLSKHNSLNGFSAPGALSQFIHPGPASPAGNGNGSSQNGGGSASSNHSFSNGSSGGSHFKTHHKHSSQHSSGSLFSSPTVMSASVNAFNTGLGNPTNLTLNGASGGINGQGSGQSSNYRSRSVSNAPSSSTSTLNSTSANDNAYDLDAALRAGIRDAEARNGSPSSSVESPGSGSSSSRTTINNQQQQQQQTIHLGPKGLNSLSHLSNQSRGRGARRGG
ncbi:hypothetical protein BGZ46_008081 [Entomortierella lignicola]|nr:hypothetical protein BGZ46_008081 [Entomortierella lignicola]